MPASNIFPRDCRAVYPQAVRGDGVYIIDGGGRQYLDACGGAAVSCLGHSNRAVIQAAQRQLEEMAFAHSAFFTSIAAEQLAGDIIKLAPRGFARAYFVSGGSEAMEAAIKLARQYFVEKGEMRRANFIARRQSYHGNTLGALSIGGNAARRKIYRPLLCKRMHFISPCHYWREGKKGESEGEYAKRAAGELEEKIVLLGAENVAAFVAETVVGATLGAVCPSPGYFRRVRDICDRYGILMILDEVMCGMGRTGTLFACEQEGVEPDIICLAKGLGAGVMPIGAALCTGAIYDAISEGGGVFRHGHTYSGHPTSCAAGVAALGEIIKLLPKVQSSNLLTQLQEAFGHHPHIADIRGRGLFIGMEFTRRAKTPFNAGDKIHLAVQRAAFAEGLMVYALGGCADGKNGDHILIAPPFIFTPSNTDELITKLTRTLKKVFG
ncbi:MAG: aspartate aminotransferase family protein [Gammaproteobacteria bacterium]